VRGGLVFVGRWGFGLWCAGGVGGGGGRGGFVGGFVGVWWWGGWGGVCWGVGLGGGFVGFLGGCFFLWGGLALSPLVSSLRTEQTECALRKTAFGRVP